MRVARIDIPQGLIPGAWRHQKQRTSEMPCTSTDQCSTISRSERYIGMASPKSDLLQGTLDLLILKTVALGPVHGYGISQRIQQVSREALQVQQGSLYPALHRLEKRGWLQATWGESESGRQAKYYRLSAKGRKQLQIEESEWNRLS